MMSIAINELEKSRYSRIVIIGYTNILLLWMTISSNYVKVGECGSQMKCNFCTLEETVPKRVEVGGICDSI